MTGMEERYRQVLSRVRALSPDATLIAVSKTHPAGRIEELYRLGQRDFGENYVQELVEKAGLLRDRCPGIRWHFIGHLQTNKVKVLVPWVHLVHTVDSERLAAELSKRWRESGRPGRLPVFLELNVDGEATKAGFLASGPTSAAELVEVAGRIAGHPELEVMGLMCIPAPSAEGAPQKAFSLLRELEARCRPHTRGALSMGMSSDFEEALRAGATHVRVGTQIFGAREAVPSPSTEK